MKAAGWILSAALLVLLVGTMDYKTEIEIENESLKAKLARRIEPPNLVHPLCPTGVMVAQRIDKRNRRGEITQGRWKTICVVSS